MLKDRINSEQRTRR